MGHFSRLTSNARMALLLALVFTGSCQKDTGESGRSSSPTVLSIAEVNYGGGAADTRAVAGGGGTTTFTDGDRLGLFLRGDAYADIDNRLVQYEYKDELWKKWNIQGDEIQLEADEAIVTGYFPYNDSPNLSVSSMPLVPGPYNVNSNDFVWQKDIVSTAHPQAMFLGMKHAMARVRLTLKNTEGSTASTVTMLRVADAGEVPQEQKVIYTDGSIDLTVDNPKADGGAKGAVSDMTAKALSDKEVRYDMLLIPVKTLSDRSVVLQAMVDDKLLWAYFPTDKADAWKAGTAYSYEVAVNENAILIRYTGGEVQDWGQNGWGFEVGGSDPAEGTVAATVDPDPAMVSQKGGKYTVTFTGEWAGNMPVRVTSGGDVLTTVNVTCIDGGGKTTLTIPENKGYERPVLFEYELGGKWTSIAAGSQKGVYELIGATTDAPSPIPQGGGTYTVTLTGTLPPSGLQARIVIGNTEGTPVNIAGGKAKINVAANTTYASRTVVFQYKWNGQWIDVPEGSRSQAGYSVSGSSTNATATIPQGGKSYTVTLTGTIPASGLKARAVISGTSTVVGAVTDFSGKTATVAVQANTTYANRTVQFQYSLDDGKNWTNVQTNGSQPQSGYSVSGATTNAPATIPQGGGSYTVTLSGTIPASVKIQAISGSTVLATGTVTKSGTAATLSKIAANASYSARSVKIQYQWNGAWKDIKTVSQAGYAITSSLSPTGNIAQSGGTYTVTLTGSMPSSGLQARAVVGSTVVGPAVTISGGKASVKVNANNTYSTRTVQFQYLWNSKWYNVASGSRSQAGYSVSSASTSAPATIPQAGGTYTVTLNGTLPSSVSIRAYSGSTTLATGTVTKSGTAATLGKIGANTATSSRTVLIQYQWNGAWTTVKSCNQPGDPVKWNDIGWGDLYSDVVSSSMLYTECKAKCESLNATLPQYHKLHGIGGVWEFFWPKYGGIKFWLDHTSDREGHLVYWEENDDWAPVFDLWGRWDAEGSTQPFWTTKANCICYRERQ